MDPARDPRRRAGPPLTGPTAEAGRRKQRIIRRREGWLGWRKLLRPPRLLRPTRAGWCFVAVILGVGFAALNTGNNLLYLVLSLMLAFLSLSGVLSESALRGIEIQRILPRDLFAETDNPIRIEVRNRQRHTPALAIVIEDRIVCEAQDEARDGLELRPVGRAFVLKVGAGCTEVRRYSFRPERRGELTFFEFQVSTRFPFGLFLKSMTLPALDRSLAYPRVEKLRAPAIWAAASQRDGGTPRPSESGESAAGLREYRHGDPMRRVHWKGSLRRQRLLVREFEQERNADVEVHLRTLGSQPGEAFEERVRWAASEWVAQLDAGYRVSLRTDHDWLPPSGGLAQRVQGLTFLAKVQPELHANAEKVA